MLGNEFGWHPMAIAKRLCLAAACVAGGVLIVGLLLRQPAWWRPAAVAAAVSMAAAVGASRRWSGYQFTSWIVAAVVAALVYPDAFLTWGPVEIGRWTLPAINLQNRWLILVVVQMVMFSMGVQMRMADFARIATTPYPVFVGVGLQFLVMPLLGFSLAKLFAFPPEIAAGVVLIGSCSSGLASNVMCYLAGANLALSITLTAVATLLAPLATPFWMKVLAGEFVSIEPVKMMMQIVEMVLLPIAAAMVHDFLKHASPQQRRVVLATAAIGGLLAVALLVDAFAGPSAAAAFFAPSVRRFVALAGGALAIGVAYHLLTDRLPWIDRRIPVLSMFGIIYFTAVTTAAGRDSLLSAGLALLAAAVIHNTAGYALGYSMSRLVGLQKEESLTVAFEVGMQNGGMASGLAGMMGKLGTVGLAAAVFSPWMNLSGSLLANQIRRRRAAAMTATSLAATPEASL